MLGRLLVCAAVMGTAAPACAGEKTRLAIEAAEMGERASYPAYALPLLLQDDRAIWGTPPPLKPLAPGFDMPGAIIVTAARPIANDLASFDMLDSPGIAFGYLPPSAEGPEIRLLTAPANSGGLTGLRRKQQEPMAGSTDAIREAHGRLPRAKRRRTPLQMLMVFRIDGEESSPVLSFGGGIGGLLNALPRQ